MKTIVRAYGRVVDSLNTNLNPFNQYPCPDGPLELINSGPTVYGKQALDPSMPQERDCLPQTRVYTISDQDDSGLWIRLTYLNAFCFCSIRSWNQYTLATWFGISGDAVFNSDPGGPDPTKVTKDSWGGRYNAIDFPPSGRHYSDAFDRVIGMDGRARRLPERFCCSYEVDIANDGLNHAPVVVVNDSTPGPELLKLETEAGDEATLDASRSFQYKEPTAASKGLIDIAVPNIDIRNADGETSGRQVKIQLPPPEKCAIDFISGKPAELGQAYRFIFGVKDNGTPSLTTYKRLITQITNRDLRGRREHAVPRFMDYLALVV
ncbi:hypothetical protein B0O99DRAFT_655573 [Bisporella sp. PMI_857]|nr:hypothetical protein B0O99DRAFT_655573 [Bisporella sp. PMI_857]